MRKPVVNLLLALTTMAAASVGHAAAADTPHRLAIQVDQNDPKVMNLALNNAQNAISYYNDHGEKVQVEIVAYGPGLVMLRADTSPVKERIRHLAEDSMPAVHFSACGNTRAAMERREGKPVPIVNDAKVVPSGVIRLMELEEAGWSYLRP